MTGRLIRTLLGVIMVVALFGATQVEAAPGLAPAACGTMSMMEGSHGGAPMPCKSMSLACQSDLGCILPPSLPSPGVAMVRVSAPAVAIVYGALHQPLVGRDVAPSLDPPISLS